MSKKKHEPSDAEILAERAAVYGEPIICHASIGLAWAGLLQQHLGQPVSPLPPHVVALMMAAVKAIRAARVYHADNYADLRNYAAIAEHAQSRPGERMT